MKMFGIRHRVKKTVDGEARPTQVCRLDEGGAATCYDLPDDQAELDWVYGRFPIAHRAVEGGDDLTSFKPWHVSWRKVREGEEPPEHLVKREGKTRFIASRVPAAYDGFRAGDAVYTALGGSGDRLALAITALAQRAGAGSVYRIPPPALAALRGVCSKESDAQTLVRLGRDRPDLFYRMRPIDREVVLIRERLRELVAAMKDRIACEQRMHQLFIGKVFCNPLDLTEAGYLEWEYEARKATDTVYRDLTARERACERSLVEALEASQVYRDVFEPVEGCGPRIAARLIAAIQDMRRFRYCGGRQVGMPKLRAFCGVHVLEGRFPRKRHGEVANWSKDARQALYLFADRCNKRPGSVWGQKLREYKAAYRATHPEPLVGEDGKKRYTDAHIHKMASWKTAAKFVDYVYRTWMPIACANGDGVAS